jgi:YbgC/YbaW family acyl-CoA thioester hydrolase
MVQQSVEKKIAWGDLDSLGIVFYPRYYEWIDESSHLLFDKIGLNLVELWKHRKLQFGLVKTGCEYFSPGRYHQKIIIQSHIEQVQQKTVTIRHTIVDKQQNRKMVSGMEKRICICEEKPHLLRACDIPGDIKAIVQKQLNG